QSQHTTHHTHPHPPPPPNKDGVVRIPPQDRHRHAPPCPRRQDRSQSQGQIRSQSQGQPRSQSQGRGAQSLTGGRTDPSARRPSLQKAALPEHRDLPNGGLSRAWAVQGAPPQTRRRPFAPQTRGASAADHAEEHPFARGAKLGSTGDRSLRRNAGAARWLVRATGGFPLPHRQDHRVHRPNPGTGQARLLQRRHRKNPGAHRAVPPTRRSPEQEQEQAPLK
ncbi:hypothetical protein T484DRAFT_1898863, partial [Baffinella frigidus]